MPKHVEIEVFNIARTAVRPASVRAWLNRLGAHDFSDSLELIPQDELSQPALVIALAAKRCYMSFEAGLNPNINRVRSNWVEYFDNVLKSGHGSVLEHATYTYAIEGVSRVFTGELNRHRAGWAISEGSMRFIRFEEISYWLPLSIRPNPDDDEQLAHKKAMTRSGLDRVFRVAQEVYKQLVETWDMDESDKNFHYKKVVTSCLRRGIPMGVATGGVWTGNIRALRHVLALRTDPAAEEEIAHAFGKIALDIIAKEPLLFGDFEEYKHGAFRPRYAKV